MTMAFLSEWAFCFLQANDWNLVDTQNKVVVYHLNVLKFFPESPAAGVSKHHTSDDCLSPTFGVRVQRSPYSLDLEQMSLHESKYVKKM